MTTETKRLLYNISALSDLSNAIASSKDFEQQISSVLHVIMGTFLANKGAIYLHEKTDHSGELVRVAKKGFERLPRKHRVRDNNPLHSSNEALRLSKLKAEDTEFAILKKFKSAGVDTVLPLRYRDRLIGLLALSAKFTGASYSVDEIELLQAVGSQIAITLHNHKLFMELSEQLEENRQLYEEMRLIYHETVQAFAAAIDAKDPYTRDHSHRVARYVVAIARELGWEENDVEGLYLAGLLHDVGKIVISDAILKKNRSLNKQEIMEIKRHPMLSYDILSKISFPWQDLVLTVKHHHERPDGKGYPDHVDESTLSVGARILSLADAFDAMTTSRPYRKKMDLKAAIEEIVRHNHLQFDPKIITAFCHALEKEIKGELPEPNIIPHLKVDFDPAVITSMLATIRDELTEHL